MSLNRYSNICRVCLQVIQKEIKAESIFENDTNSISASKRIYDISGVFIEPSHNLPDKICRECNSTLIIAYSFRLKCLKSEEKLKVYIEHNYEVVVCDNKKEELEIEGNLEDNENANSVVLEEDPMEDIESLDTVNYLNVEILDRYQTTFNVPSVSKEIKAENISIAEDIYSQKVKPENDCENSTKELDKIKIKSKFKQRTSKRKHYTQFNLAWLKTYDWIRQAEDYTYAHCIICARNFSIGHGGKTDIVGHSKTTKHILNKTNSLILNEECQNSVIDEDNKEDIVKEIIYLNEKSGASSETNSKNKSIKYARKSKRKCFCHFSVEWLDTYSWIRPSKEETFAHCLICQKDFSIGHGGKFDIARHTKTAKHMVNKSKTYLKKNIFKFDMTWLETYKWIKHSKKETYAYCSVCEEDFSIERGGEVQIKHHMKTEKHAKILPKTLLAKNTVAKNKTNTLCEICGNKYSSEKLLKAHMIYHSNILKFDCEICFKKFRNASQVTRHIRVHTGEKPYQCSFCGKMFGDCSTKIKHERVHKNEKPFVCETCGKSFTCNYSLTAHKVVHTGEKSFRCDICDTDFARKSNLQAHFQTVLHKSRVEQKHLLKLKL